MVTLPEGVTFEFAFCPTGKGGGVDPSCGSGKGESGKSVAMPDSLDADGNAKKRFAL